MLFQPMKNWILTSDITTLFVAFIFQTRLLMHVVYLGLFWTYAFRYMVGFFLSTRKFGQFLNWGKELK